MQLPPPIQTIIKKIRGQFKGRGYIYSVVAPLLLLPLAIFFQRFDLAQRLENQARDTFMRIQHKPNLIEENRVLFVGVDDESLQQLGRWPFPRKLHGQLLAIIGLAKPAVVTWDILFIEEDSVENDSIFRQGILESGVPVVLGAAFASEGSGTEPEEFEKQNLGLTSPLPCVRGDITQVPGPESVLSPNEAFRKVASLGFVNSPPDSDGVRRKMPLVVRVENALYPNLALQALMHYWKLKPKQVEIILGDRIIMDNGAVHREIPIDEQGLFLVNYRYNTTELQGINYSGLLLTLYEELVEGKQGRYSSLVKDNILLVGQSSTGLSDNGPTAIAPLSPLPLLHLNTLANILREDFLQEVGSKWVWIGCLALSIASLLLLVQANFWVSISVPALVLGIYLSSAYYAFAKANLLLPVVLPTLAFASLHVGAVGRRFLAEQKERHRIKTTLAPYLDKEIIEKVLASRGTLELGGQRKPVTIVFTDIRDFTTITEMADEEVFISQLNEYFTEMVACINRYGGTLHKFIGDAIMVAWGDTVSNGVEEDATNALMAALAMLDSLAALNHKWQAEGKIEFRMGVGVNHGRVVVGNVGAPQRMEFTLFGDAVNLASRMEGLTKQFVTQIAVGDQLKTLTGDRFVFRTLGIIQVKGKTKGVKILEVLSTREKFTNESDKQWLQHYEAGFNHYEKAEFQQATESFRVAHNERPNDYCTRFYLEDSEELFKNPPGDGWACTYVAKTK